MKFYRLVLIFLFGVIFSSAISLRKFKNKAQKTDNQFLMNEMMKTASQILSKSFFSKELKKDLFKALFEKIVLDHKINDEYTCRSVIEKAANDDGKLFLPSYFENFVESGDLDQDLTLRTRLFFSAQESPDVKKCTDYIISKDTKEYDIIKSDLLSEIKLILEPYKAQVANTSHELITSIISVHRELASKQLYKRLNRESD
jgi:hypothetical protein